MESNVARSISLLYLHLGRRWLTRDYLSRGVAIILCKAGVNVDIIVTEVLHRDGDGGTVSPFGLRISECVCTRRPKDTMSSAVCLTILSVMLHCIRGYYLNF